MADAADNRLRLLVKVLGELLLGEVRETARDRRRAADPAVAEKRRAVAVRQALERLGPFYVKLGQVLSTRPDLVPPSMIAELQNLHDQVQVQPFSVLEPVLAQELGPDWKLLFDDIDTIRPLGAASVAQVHRATLAGGRPVVLKIQRPGIRTSVLGDMALLRRAARLVARGAPRFNAVMDLEAMLGSLFDAMEPELDFTGEAANMETARAPTRAYRTLAVPDVIHATQRVLVQSMAVGTSIRHADRGAFTDRQREEVCKDLLRFMYRGYFIDRFFHADPHPGNVILSPDGTATLIDWGMVGRIDKRTSMHLALVLMAVAQNDGHSLAKAWTQMGHATPWADMRGFAMDMASLAPKLASASLDQLNFGAAFTAVLEKASRRGIASAPCVSLLGKSFGNLDGAVRCLCPEVVVSEVFKKEITGILGHMIQEFASPQQLAYNWTELLISSTAALEQLRQATSDIADRNVSVRVYQGRLPRALGAERSGSHRGLLVLAAAAYLLDRRKSR